MDEELRNLVPGDDYSVLSLRVDVPDEEYGDEVDA